MSRLHDILTVLANPDLTKLQRLLLAYLNAQQEDEIITNYTIIGEDIVVTEQTADRTIRELVRAGYMQKKTLSKVGVLLSNFRA